MIVRSSSATPVVACTAQHTPAATPRQRRLAKKKRKYREEIYKGNTQHQSTADLPTPLAAAAAARPSLSCPHFAACSGCTLDTKLDEPPLLNEARQFFEADCGLGSQFQLHVAGVTGWRQRARLAVRQGRDGQAVVGLFAEGTHTPIGIPSCVVHHPAINEVVQLLSRALRECRVQIYNEEQHSGQLRYVQLTVVQPGLQQEQAPDAAAGGICLPSQPAAAAVQLVLVWNPDGEGLIDDSLSSLAHHLWRHGTATLLHSIWANFQPAQTNTILGDSWRLLHGAERAWARLGGVDICFGPGSFMQANFEAMDRCLAAMQPHVPLGSTIADLHAGVGTIGLSLAATRQPRWVRFVEINGNGLAPFQQSAARLRHRLTQSVDDHAEPAADAAAVPELTYHVAAAGSDPARWCQGAEVVVCDPPRKGLEPALLRWLCSPAAGAAGVRRMLYLSCGFPALRRDAAQLLGSGRWRLRHAEAFLFFPGTDHIETLAVFDAAT